MNHLKWVGGKLRFAPIIADHLPAGEPYVEPFAGSLAVFMERTRRAGRPLRAIVNDALPALANLYQQVQASPVAVHAAMTEFPRAPTPGEYAAVRDAFNDRAMDDVQLAGCMLWLNRVCFNGLWRCNAKGRFNVARGSFPDAGPGFPSLQVLCELSAALDLTSIRQGDYRDLDIQDGAVVYCDPPYVGDFTAYDGAMFDHQAFTAWAVELAKRCRVVVTNHHDEAFMAAMAPAFEVVATYGRRNSVSCGARSLASEVVLASRT